ncbi:MAG: helix-turn-helix domain-containing protein [Hyphomicrobiales bacterium]
MAEKTFDDFDAFADTIRDVDATMTLQNPSDRSWIVNQADAAGVEVQFGQLGSGNIVDGCSWSNGYLLYLPLTDGVAYSINGKNIAQNAAAIFEPGCEFCLSTREAHDWCTIFVTSDEISKASAPLESLMAIASPAVRQSRPNPLLTLQFRTMVNEVMTSAATSPLFSSSAAATNAKADLTQLAVSLIGTKSGNSSCDRGRPTLSRRTIIERSMELLKEQDVEKVSVRDLAVNADVSERTLRTAFQEYFGTGPVRYLQLRQLHRVRKALRNAYSDTATVSNILVQNGVWEFSRFAARYRKLFGELPSETLAKN